MEKWFIVQTRPRWEKKVADCLEQKGIQIFCPVKKVRRKWSDRMKTIEEPVFKACVFVKITMEQRTAVRLTDGVVNIIYSNGKPAVVKEKEIDTLRKLIPVSEVLVFEKLKERQNEKQHQSFQAYLDHFNQWLATCMERPKLV
jgi:transcription antitermination factor NusG